MPGSIPSIEVAHDADDSRIRSPHGEANTYDTIQLRDVCAERTIAFVIGAFAMQVEFERREQRGKTIRIFDNLRFASIQIHLDLVIAPRG